MAGYVSVRSNWSSVNSMSLDLVCDVAMEEKNQSTVMDKPGEEQEEEHTDLRKTTSSDEQITHITLRYDHADQREDPVIILRVLQADQHQIDSIQLLSSAKHIEFYQREYIGSCHGSRVTELDSESIYESSFEFPQAYEEITLKFLKLADTTELIVYCLQITMSKSPSPGSSIPSVDLPFDLDRVRSMIDETHLSSNARQFMNDLQHMQEHRRAKEVSSPQFNLGSLMSLMTGMKASSAIPKQVPPAPLSSILNELKSSCGEQVKSTSSQDSEKTKEEFNVLERRLQAYVDKRFSDLQEHIDARFDRLEAMLAKTL